jgi:hypothetical protein
MRGPRSVADHGLQQALDRIPMHAELRCQLGGSMTGPVDRYQAIDVLGREAHLDLPWRYSLGSLPRTPDTLRQAQQAVPRV